MTEGITKEDLIREINRLVSALDRYTEAKCLLSDLVPDHGEKGSDRHSCVDDRAREKLEGLVMENEAGKTQLEKRLICSRESAAWEAVVLHK